MHDIPAYNDTPPYQVWLQKIERLRYLLQTKSGQTVHGLHDSSMPPTHPALGGRGGSMVYNNIANTDCSQLTFNTWKCGTKAHHILPNFSSMTGNRSWLLKLWWLFKMFCQTLLCKIHKITESPPNFNYQSWFFLPLLPLFLVLLMPKMCCTIKAVLKIINN